MTLLITPQAPSPLFIVIIISWLPSSSRLYISFSRRLNNGHWASVTQFKSRWSLCQRVVDIGVSFESYSQINS